MHQVTLSIIILNYNTKHLLRLALKNLQTLGMTIPYEIIVVDNNSQDGSAEMVEHLYPTVQLIKNTKNTGHAHGNNLGINAAQGKYVLIMNSDIIFLQPSDIEKVIAYLNAHPEVGLLGPKLLNGDGSIQYSCFRPYSKYTPIFRRTPLGKLPSAKRDLEHHLMQDFNHDSIQPVDWLLGAVLFGQTAVLQKYHGFDERFFLYFADYELCDRLKFYNYQIVYYSEVAIVHYHRRESAQGSVWGGLGSLLNYTTRVHLKDWFTYLTNKKAG